MKLLHVIIASAVLLGFSLPHCAGGMLFVSTAMAAIPEPITESQLQSSVNTDGTQDLCVYYNPCIEGSHRHKDKAQCDACYVCIGETQYIPNRDMIDNKEITLSFVAFANCIKYTESKSQGVTYHKIAPSPLFEGARTHASTIAMLK